MFRTPNTHRQLNSRAIEEMCPRIDQSIRFYRVPSIRSREDALNILLQRIKLWSIPISRTKQSHTIIIAIASAAAAILFILLLRFDNSRIDCQSSDGEYCTVILANENRAILSPASTLNYFSSVMGPKAKVKGEAYLEIKQKKDLSIIMSTGTLNTRNARLLINTLSDKTEVTCYEGLVEFKAKESKQKSILTVGERILMNQHALISKEFIKEQYPAQAYYSESFEDVPVDAVLSSIETFFGIEVKSNFPLSRRFTGSIYTPLYNEALDIICISMSYKWSLKGSKEIDLVKDHQN